MPQTSVTKQQKKRIIKTDPIDIGVAPVSLCMPISQQNWIMSVSIVHRLGYAFHYADQCDEYTEGVLLIIIHACTYLANVVRKGDDFGNHGIPPLKHVAAGCFLLSLQMYSDTWSDYKWADMTALLNVYMNNMTQKELFYVQCWIMDRFDWNIWIVPDHATPVLPTILSQDPYWNVRDQRGLHDLCQQTLSFAAMKTGYLQAPKHMLLLHRRSDYLKVATELTSYCCNTGKFLNTKFKTANTPQR